MINILGSHKVTDAETSLLQMKQQKNGTRTANNVA